MKPFKLFLYSTAQKFKLSFFISLEERTKNTKQEITVELKGK